MNCLIPMLLLTVLPSDFQGIWYVSHEENPITEKMEFVGEAALRATEDSFRFKDGKVIAIDRVREYRQEAKLVSLVIFLENDEHIIVVPSDKTIMAAWYRKHKERSIKYKLWFMQIK